MTSDAEATHWFTEALASKQRITELEAALAVATEALKNIVNFGGVCTDPDDKGEPCVGCTADKALEALQTWHRYMRVEYDGLRDREAADDTGET